MSPIHRWAPLVGLLTLAGCTRPEEYVEVAQAQRAALEEVRVILAGIRDEKDLEAAKAELDRRFDRFESVARKAAALPKPPPGEAETRLKEELPAYRRSLEELKREARRVKALPGCDRFFERYEGSSLARLVD